jgi:hypothetical protein
MKTRLILAVAIAWTLATVVLAQESSPTTAGKSSGSSAPYNEGTVWVVSMIKTKTGLEDEYLKQIAGTVKPVYEEAKKQKIVLSYKILTGESSSPHDFNILILVEYSNMAALDGLRAKMDPVLAKVMGSEEQRTQMAVKRLDVREILGTKTMREITLK